MNSRSIFSARQDLVELAVVSLLPAEEEVPGHLHGDGAAPRPLLPGADEVQHGAGQALPVDPGVLEEPVVLACENRLDEPLRNVVEPQGRAAFLAELGEELALAGIDPQQNLKTYVAEDLRRGELGRQIPVDTADTDRYGEHRQQHEDAENTECAGESNHGLCSTRGRAADRPSTAHRQGVRPSAGGVYAGGLVGTMIGVGGRRVSRPSGAVRPSVRCDRLRTSSPTVG